MDGKNGMDKRNGFLGQHAVTGRYRPNRPQTLPGFAA